jgi:methyl-accepting chemotaxis protein
LHYFRCRGWPVTSPYLFNPDHCPVCGGGAFFGGLLFWSVNDALQRILGYLKEMTDGNLRQTISAKRNNEISAIIRSIATLQTAMQTMISGIRQTSDSVASASDRLRQTAETIADGTGSAASQSDAVSQSADLMASVSSRDRLQLRYHVGHGHRGGTGFAGR